MFRNRLPIGISVISKDKHAKEMALQKRYRVKLDWNSEMKEKDRLESLRYMGGNVLLIISDCQNAYLEFLSKYDLNLGKYKELSEAKRSEGKLVFLLDGDREKAYLVNSAWVSGDVQETELGIYNYYESDGRFWMYMNGNELLTGDVDDDFEFREPLAIFYK